MKRTRLLFTGTLLMSASASAKTTDSPDGPHLGQRPAPHSNGIDTPEQEPEPNRLANTSDAELYIFPADTSESHRTVAVICPEAVAGRLAIDHEGYERWRNGSPRTASPARC